MKHLIIFILILSYLQSNSQIIMDKYSEERDITLYKFNCKSNLMVLKRVLTPVENGVSFSVRKGRELLVACNEEDEVKFKFKEIGGYSSLYFNKESFKLFDLNKDGNKELFIEIDPFESPKSLWIYSLDRSCNFNYIDKLECNEYSINEEELKITKSLLSEILEDDTDTRFMFIFSQLDLSKFTNVNYYKLINSELVNTNKDHSEEIAEQVKNYKAIVAKLNLIHEKETPEVEKKKIIELIKFFNEKIDSYKKI